MRQKGERERRLQTTKSTLIDKSFNLNCHNSLISTITYINIFRHKPKSDGKLKIFAMWTKYKRYVVLDQ